MQDQARASQTVGLPDAGTGVSVEEKQRGEELLLQLFPKSSLIPI